MCGTVQGHVKSRSARPCCPVPSRGNMWSRDMLVGALPFPVVLFHPEATCGAGTCWMPAPGSLGMTSPVWPRPNGCCRKTSSCPCTCQSTSRASGGLSRYSLCHWGDDMDIFISSIYHDGHQHKGCISIAFMLQCCRI